MCWSGVSTRRDAAAESASQGAALEEVDFQAGVAARCVYRASFGKSERDVGHRKVMRKMVIGGGWVQNEGSMTLVGLMRRCAVAAAERKAQKSTGCTIVWSGEGFRIRCRWV